MTKFFNDGTADSSLAPLALANLAASSSVRRKSPAVLMTEPGMATALESASPEELAGRCRRGCPDSFAQLVSLYQDRIFSYLWRLTGNPHDAEDITQDTFLKAYRALDRFDGSGSFTSWLFIIAKRTGLNHLRSTRRETVSETAEEIEHATPAILLEQRDEQQSIWNLARKLKPGQYEALWLRYGEGFSIAETARIMNTNQIRVRVLIHRARSHLVKLLEQDGAWVGRPNSKSAGETNPASRRP